MSNAPDPTQPPPPPTQPDAPTTPSSVIIDEHASVKVKRWPIWVVIGAVLVFIAFTAVWFAVEGNDDYKPGPFAQQIQDSLLNEYPDMTLSTAEMSCIDRAGHDAKVDDLAPDTFDPLANDVPAALVPAMIEIFDNCFERATRVKLLVDSLKDEYDTVTDEQAQCASEKVDDIVMQAGGWAIVIDQDENNLNPALVGVITALSDCGIDVFG